MSVAPSSPWSPILSDFPDWNAPPDVVTLKALSTWGSVAKNAKARALARFVRFGRQHRHQTDVNNGVADGVQVRLADLCAAYGCTEKWGRAARDIWDHITTNANVLPDEWFGLGSGDVHDMVTGKTPRSKKTLSPEVLFSRFLKGIDAHAPMGSEARAVLKGLTREWLDRDDVASEPERRLEPGVVALCPPDKESWEHVERIRSLGKEALMLLVARQRRIVDRVWVAYAAHRTTLVPGDLVELVYGPDPSRHPGRPTRAPLTWLEALCVERVSIETAVFLPLDPKSHSEQVGLRRIRRQNDAFALQARNEKFELHNSLVSKEMGHDKAA